MLIQKQISAPGVGVFGCNRQNEYLINYLIKYGFKVTAIWSDCLEEACEFAKRFLIDFYTDKVDVLLLKKEVELVLINCHQSHYVQIVTKAFRIGKHVLCDWPSSLTANELNIMHEAASYYPSLISIYSFPLRFLPQFKIMRNLIQEQNYIGDITLINVNINGRTLIEMDDIEQMINQSNCIYCKEKEEFITDESSEEKNLFEKPDESLMEDQFVDPNKVDSLNVQNKQKNCKLNQNFLNRSQNFSIDKCSLDAIKQNEQQKQFKSAIDLIKRLKISSQKNKKYKDIMKEGGILSSLGPHVIDIISYVTNLKVKKCNGILRTFNSSPFFNEFSLIKRINVDDFCTFQLQMEKSSISSTSNKPSNTKIIDEKVCKDKKSINNQTNIKSNIKVKELANNKPIAIVTLNDHLEMLDKSYEIVIAGDFGYLRLKDGNLFGKQYEQNNNGSVNSKYLDEEKAFYSVKINNPQFNNFCVKHRDEELSKFFINKRLFRPFNSGLENMIESMKSAFDNEQISNEKILFKSSTKFNNVIDNKDTSFKKEILITNENKKNAQMNTDFAIKQTNERNQQPLKFIQIDKPVDKLIVNRNSKEYIKDNCQINGNLNNQSNNKLSNHLEIRLTNGHQMYNQEADIEINGIKNISSSNVNRETCFQKNDAFNAKQLGKAVETNKDASKLNEFVKNNKNGVLINERYCNKLQRIKEAICMASDFENGKYVQSVIEAIRLSSVRCEWVQPQMYSVKTKQ